VSASLPTRALVLGLARSGLAATTALERRGVEVVAVDRRRGDDEDISLLSGVELLVKSPGVPDGHPMVSAAEQRGIPVWSEVELGYRLLPDSRFVGVTGTNGKTTTTELLGAIFREAGRDVAVAGNVGRPLTAVEAADWVVCELSSFQLVHIAELRCDVAVLLNLEPDHLDRHGTLEAYRRAKLRIFENQTDRDWAVVPRKLGPIPGSARRLEFGPGDPLPAELRIPGAHNRENAVAAAAAARAAGVENDAIARALAVFPGVAHRLEPVGDVGGVRYVNDSKATNVSATLRALAAYDAPLRVILGGRAKGETFAPLASVRSQDLRAVYVIGEAAEEIASAFEGARADVQVERCGDLASAVRAASTAARPGDVVLLSPACASYDQFENFEQRGEEFRRLVQNLTL
jgi:UDP-N-acetylmuramoylalanine--D-glutamate ligase